MNGTSSGLKGIDGKREMIPSRSVMEIAFDRETLRGLVQEVVMEVVGLGDWPDGRLALDEAEAAAACGVARHVMRDLRLAGRIKARKLGRKIVYTRADVLAALSSLSHENQP
jgi:hypothetical protein